MTRVEFIQKLGDRVRDVFLSSPKNLGKTMNHSPLVLVWNGAVTILDSEFPKDEDIAVQRSFCALQVARFVKLRPDGIHPPTWLALILRAMSKHWTGGPPDLRFEDQLLVVMQRVHGTEGMAELLSARDGEKLR